MPDKLTPQDLSDAKLIAPSSEENQAVTPGNEGDPIPLYKRGSDQGSDLTLSLPESKMIAYVAAHVGEPVQRARVAQYLGCDPRTVTTYAGKLERLGILSRETGAGYTLARPAIAPLVEPGIGTADAPKAPRTESGRTKTAYPGGFDSLSEWALAALLTDRGIPYARPAGGVPVHDLCRCTLECMHPPVHALATCDYLLAPGLAMEFRGHNTNEMSFAVKNQMMNSHGYSVLIVRPEYIQTDNVDNLIAEIRSHVQKAWQDSSPESRLALQCYLGDRCPGSTLLKTLRERAEPPAPAKPYEEIWITVEGDHPAWPARYYRAGTTPPAPRTEPPDCRGYRKPDDFDRTELDKRLKAQKKADEVSHEKAIQRLREIQREQGAI